MPAQAVISVPRLCEVFQKSHPWITARLREMEIEPSLLVDGVPYFDEELSIAMLRDYLDGRGTR